MTDDDIYAFGAPPAPAPPPTAPRPARVGRWLLLGALVFLLVAAGTGLLGWLLLTEVARDGLHVVVNGEPWLSGGDFDGAHVVLGLLGVGLACLIVTGVVTVVVPLALLLALLAAALGLGAGLLAIVLVAALALSPLWLILLVLWLLLRRRPPPAATIAR